MVLDRREPRDLHFVGVANEDAALLRLGDELVHGTRAHVAVLRDIEAPDVAPGADGLEDRVRTGDGLADRLVRRCGLVRAGRDAADRFAVPLLAAAALTPSPTLRCGTRPAGAAAPAHRPALSLGLTALVTRELTRLLALFTRDEGLRTERRRAELRTLCAELRTRPTVRRPRASKATAAPAASAAAAAPSAARAILIAKLLGRRRARRVVRSRRWAWPGARCGLARGFVTLLGRPLVLSAV